MSYDGPTLRSDLRLDRHMYMCIYTFIIYLETVYSTLGK